MTHGSLFSGIGGFDLAAEWMGWENIFHCEWNPFGQKVLNHYWPNAESFTDITKSDFNKYANRIDVLSGGDPCQPHSVAGLQKGEEDDRYLWPQYKRAIIEIQPMWVVNENVQGSISNGVLDKKIDDLEAINYAWWPPLVIPASSQGADHERKRVFLIAHSKRKGLQGFNAKRKNLCVNERPAFSKPSYGNVFTGYYGPRSNGEHIRRSNGIPTQLHKRSIHALGNAIVPQVAFEIFKAIQSFENKVSD